MTEEPTPTFDLERLKALRAKATQGEWLNGERIMPDDRCDALRYEEHADIYRVTEDGNCNIACATFDAGDADFVVALVNAFPDMAKEIERLTRELDAERDKVGLLMQPVPETQGEFPWQMMRLWVANRDAEKATHRAELDKLRADLAGAEKREKTAIEQADYFRSRSLALEADRRNFLLDHGIDLGERPEAYPKETKS